MGGTEETPVVPDVAKSRMKRNHKQNLMIMSWHSEPTKMDQIGKENEEYQLCIDQEANRVMCQMKTRILSLRTSFQLLRELTQKCSLSDVASS